MKQSLLFQAPGRVRAIAVFWLLGALLTSAQAATNRLQSMQTRDLGAGRAEITLTLEHTAPMPSVFDVEAPARLSIDLPNTALAVDERHRNVQAGPITGLTLAADNNRARLVVALTHPVTYHVNRDGNRIHIHLDANPAANLTQLPNDMLGASNRVANVDFRRGEAGSGKVEISFNGIGGAISTERRGSKLITTIPHTFLPRALEKRLDVLDFATPVKYVDIYARGNDTEIVVTPIAGAQYTHMAYQSGNRFTLELTPLAATKSAAGAGTSGNQVAASNEPEFSGEEISLSFQRIDVRAVLQIIADIADVNMVVADNVAGEVTLELKDVPWDQALNIILRTQGLGMRQIGNVISVAPLEQIAKRENAEQAAKKATENADPLQSEIIQINFAKAEEIAALLSSDSGKESSMLSDRGRVTVDQRTNSLLVNETAERLQEIRRVIANLDIPIRQVQIEARIVVANRGFSRELGLISQSPHYRHGSSGNESITDAGYTINLPSGTLGASILRGNFSLDLLLSALETEDRGEIISSPRVITTDGQDAIISQGQEVPYTTQQGRDNPATTEFKEVVLELDVTPHITPNDHVLLDMELTQDNVNGYTPSGEPVIDTRNVKTQVLVDNGNTVVLGGIYQHEDTNSRSKVPFLGDLPLVGVLFSHRQRALKKLELLIFITPEILQETLTEVELAQGVSRMR